MSYLRIFRRREPGSMPLDPRDFAPDKMPANVAPSHSALQAAMRRTPEIKPTFADPRASEKLPPRSRRR